MQCSVALIDTLTVVSWMLQCSFTRCCCTIESKVAGGTNHCLRSAHAAHAIGGAKTSAVPAAAFGVNGKSTSKEPYLMTAPRANETPANLSRNARSLSCSTGGRPLPSAPLPLLPLLLPSSLRAARCCLMSSFRLLVSAAWRGGSAQSFPVGRPAMTTARAVKVVVVIVAVHNKLRLRRFELQLHWRPSSPLQRRYFVLPCDAISRAACTSWSQSPIPNQPTIPLCRLGERKLYSEIAPSVQEDSNSLTLADGAAVTFLQQPSVDACAVVRVPARQTLDLVAWASILQTDGACVQRHSRTVASTASAGPHRHTAGQWHSHGLKLADALARRSALLHTRIKRQQLLVIRIGEIAATAHTAG